MECRNAEKENVGGRGGCHPGFDAGCLELTRLSRYLLQRPFLSRLLSESRPALLLLLALRRLRLPLFLRLLVPELLSSHLFLPLLQLNVALLLSLLLLLSARQILLPLLLARLPLLQLLLS